MTSKSQSHQFPGYMSEYYKAKQNEDTLEIINEETSESVFHRQAFSICEIIGNFENGFIVIHFEGLLYLVDQHAASEKSLFLQYMLNPTKKYTTEASYLTFLPNYYRETLEEHRQQINDQGWVFEEVQRKAGETVLRISQAPFIYGKELREEDFLFCVDQLYNEREGKGEYSNNERNYMASFACHNAIKVGDRLRLFEMRGLLDSLYKMDAPFNCPHGRPIIVSLGRVAERKTSIAEKRVFAL